MDTRSNRCSVIYRPPGSAACRHQLAGDRPGLIRGQKDRDKRDLRRVYHAADGIAARRIRRKVPAFGLFRGYAQLGGAGGEQAQGALGAGRTGMNTIDRNPMTTQLDRQRFCHVHQGGIAGATAEIAGVAGVAATDVDDAAPARRLHERDDGAGTAQRAHILDVEILDQILVDDGFDRAGRGGRPAWVGTAVDQDVQTAQLMRRLGDYALHLFLAGDIGGEGQDAPVRRGSKLPRRRLQIPLGARHDRDINPFASQFPRNGLPNAAAAAGHDRMLVLQSEVHGILSLVGVSSIFWIHRLLFSLKEPGARVAGKCGAMHRTRLRRWVRQLASGEFQKHALFIAVHASWPDGSRITSFSEKSCSEPSSITTRSVPDKTRATCESSQLLILAYSLTSFDHFHASNVPPPLCSSPPPRSCAMTFQAGSRQSRDKSDA